MATPSSVRLATMTPAFARDATSAAARDWVAAADPDAVVPVSGAGAAARRFLARDVERSIPVLDPASLGVEANSHQVGRATVTVAPSAASLATTLATEGEEAAGTQGAPCLFLTDALTMSVDTTALSTTIEGRDALEGDPASGDREQVVISTGLPAGYRTRIAGTRVAGIGTSGDPSATDLPVLAECERRVLHHSVDPERLGLEAIRGVGPTRAETLRAGGFERRSAVAEASLAALRDLDGFGASVAETVQASARAIAEGRVVRQSRAPLPARDPLFVDIETDGLHPTVTWLIGVLDGGPDDGAYQSFIARSPDDPGAAIDAFLSWYAAEASGRTLVAYNGRSFDFPVLRDHARAYRPAFEPVLDAADRFDPYAWAIDEGNALLPGRTNRLDDVAGGLGFEPDTAGLTGAAVARTYRRWVQSPGPDTEPDWDRLDRYCEDDVRALARVYRALEADTDTSGGIRSRDGVGSAAGTTQGTLSEW